MWDKPTVLNWIANLLFALSIVAMLYMALYAVVHSSLFPLNEVKVEGELQHVNREQVKLIVEKHLRGNFFTLDLVEARNVFEKLPWARKVSVRRRWPDRLDVTIEEHVAMARWDTPPHWSIRTGSFSMRPQVQSYRHFLALRMV